MWNAAKNLPRYDNPGEPQTCFKGLVVEICSVYRSTFAINYMLETF